MIVGLPSGGVAMRLRLAESGLNIGTLMSISIGLGLLQGARRITRHRFASRDLGVRARV